MIGSLRGRVVIRRTSEVIIEVSGVGYLVSVPTNTLSELPIDGREVFLHVYTHVREDAIQLFGFALAEEKKAFTTLLGITGIGPKVALSVISAMPYEDFLRAVENEDITQLTRVPGLGKKTAQRIVLELRGKLARDGAAASSDPVFDDSISALINLGYKKAEAAAAVEHALKGGAKAVEEIIKASLQFLTGDRHG